MWNIKKSKCRKVGPIWALPNEVWRLLLCQSTDFKQPRAGIGCPEYFSKFESFRYVIMQVLLKVRVTNTTPLSWHRSRVFSLFKKNPALVDVPFDSQRSIHSLDPFGKSFYRHLWNSSSTPSPLPNEFGYVKNRRRESAIKQVLINQYRLSVANVSFVSVSHDMTNAFASTNFETLDKNVNTDSRECDTELLQQRYKHASIHVVHDDDNSPTDYTIGSGSLPGDKIASDFFLGHLENQSEDGYSYARNPISRLCVL
jgi:hypothetical protein